MSGIEAVPYGAIGGAVPLGQYAVDSGMAPTFVAPSSTEGAVPYTSFSGNDWKPRVRTNGKNEKVPCGHPTKKGKPCQMFRAYDPKTGQLTELCKSHWTTVFALASKGLSESFLGPKAA
jgi:hypothetical protein